MPLWSSINSQDYKHAQAANDRQRRDRMPLHMFLRLIGGGRVLEREAAATNDDLVRNLKRNGTITQ